MAEGKQDLLAANTSVSSVDYITLTTEPGSFGKQLVLFTKGGMKRKSDLISIYLSFDLRRGVTCQWPLIWPFLQQYFFG